jgi:hypothetical protein
MSHSIKYLAESAAEIEQWLSWEKESLELFHAYGQLLGCTPGGNVYMFVLEDALKGRGITMRQFCEKIAENLGNG